MPSTSIVKLDEKQFAALCDKIYETFLSHLDEKERKKIKKLIGDEEGDWKKFFKQRFLYKDDGITTLKDDFERHFEVRFKGIVNLCRRENPKINFDISDCAFLTVKYLYNKCTPSGKKDGFVYIGGSKKWEHQHYQTIFFEYIGYDNYEEFKGDLFPKPSSSKDPHTDSGWDFLYYPLDREKELNYKLWEEFAGKWKFEALEDQIRFNSEKIYLPPGETIDSHVPKISRKDLVYNYRQCYWADLEFEKTPKPGFFLGKGKLKSDLIEGEQELTSWNFEMLCSIRTTHFGKYYLSCTCELIPDSDDPEHTRKKTFGHLMLKDCTTSRLKNPILFQGFYLSNRVRVPLEEGDIKEDIPFNKTGIAVGRCTLYRPALSEVKI